MATKYYHEEKRPSKRLTNEINKWYSNETERLEASRTARALDEVKQDLSERILSLIDDGFEPKNSEYGVMVIEQSSRLAYESLYTTLVETLAKKLPEYKEVIKQTSEKLQKKAFDKLEMKRAVVCDKNPKLVDLMKNAEKAQYEERRTKREVEQVIYAK